MRTRDASAGLTLLEVLGAVALLGILYTALAGNAANGLRSEGESRRRLAASLLADDRLAEFELSLASGTVPTAGTEEEEVEGFSVSTEVRPFQLPARKEEPHAEPTSLAAKRAAERTKDAPSLFAPPRNPTAPSVLLSIDVVVRWKDGVFEREVRRTTYAVDASAVEAAFEALAEFQAQHPPEEAAGSEATQPGQSDRQNTTGRRQQRLQRQQQQRQQQQQGGGPMPQVKFPVPNEGVEP